MNHTSGFDLADAAAHLEAAGEILLNARTRSAAPSRDVARALCEASASLAETQRRLVVALEGMHAHVVELVEARSAN